VRTHSTVKDDVFAYEVGEEVRLATRPFSIERVQEYSIGLMSAASGERKPPQYNIHTDHDYARTQGLEAAIADGMHSTNWLSTMMSDHFGPDYLVNGALRTKYIKPTFLDVPVTARGVITGKEKNDDGSVRYALEVWCEDDKGTKLTVGDASVTVTSESR